MRYVRGQIRRYTHVSTQCTLPLGSVYTERWAGSSSSSINWLGDGLKPSSRNVAQPTTPDACPGLDNARPLFLALINKCWAEKRFVASQEDSCSTPCPDTNQGGFPECTSPLARASLFHFLATSDAEFVPGLDREYSPLTIVPLPDSSMLCRLLVVVWLDHTIRIWVCDLLWAFFFLSDSLDRLEGVKFKPQGLKVSHLLPPLTPPPVPLVGGDVYQVSTTLS